MISGDVNSDPGSREVWNVWGTAVVLQELLLQLKQNELVMGYHCLLVHDLCNVYSLVPSFT